MARLLSEILQEPVPGVQVLPLKPSRELELQEDILIMIFLHLGLNSDRP